MLFRRANLPQRGVRRIEALGIDPDGLLTSTLATHDRHSVGIAIRRAADAYVNLRADALPDNIADGAARRAVLAMLDAYSHKGKSIPPAADAAKVKAVVGGLILRGWVAG